jgi:hypothetical protein
MCSLTTSCGEFKAIAPPRNLKIVFMQIWRATQDRQMKEKLENIKKKQ